MLGAQILMVEDDPDLLEAYSFWLRRYGWVKLARTVQEALGVLDSHPIDIIILDYELPDGTGIDVLYHVFSQNLPAVSILFTGMIQNHEIAQRACRYQPAGYVEKPALPQDLECAMKRALEIRNRKRVAHAGLIPPLEQAALVIDKVISQMRKRA